MAPSLWDIVRRSTLSDIESSPQTFSSWHNCMQKSYCKYANLVTILTTGQIRSDQFRWPVIIGIIIASVVVFSVVWCCVRCLCCGLSCCCDCLTCCDSCRGRRKRSKYADGPPAFAPYQGYQPAPAPPVYEPPRFATFDAPSNTGKIHEDSLPAMPSWDTASSRRVEDHSLTEDMEMGNLGSHAGQQTGVVATGARMGRGGYSQISDQAQSPYGNGPAEYRGSDITHNYGSDLGAQRLAADETGHSAYTAAPGIASPYLQNGPYGGTGSHSQMSPYREVSPYAPNHQLSPDRAQSYFPPSSPPRAPANYGPYNPTQPVYAPYSTAESTRYAPTTTDGSGVRPPSLLQAGRKPIQGSSREV